MTTLIPRRYMRNPLYVHAEQVSASNMATLAEWCGGTIQSDAKAKAFIKVNVLRPTQVRQGQAYVGDWILKTESGYKVYGDKAFQKDFVEAPEESDPKALALLESIFSEKPDPDVYHGTLPSNVDAITKAFNDDLAAGTHVHITTGNSGNSAA